MALESAAVCKASDHGHSITAPIISAAVAAPAPHIEASLCQALIFEACAGASDRASGAAEVGVIGLFVGSGSDLSEEPAFQDVEPVTLDFCVVPDCPPGPTSLGQ